jgi:peptide/nickel transport system substrate-binding protein
MKEHCIGYGCRIVAVSAAVLALAAIPARHAEAQVNKNWITIVLPAEPEGLEPCMSSRAHQGRVIKYNVTETLIQKRPEDGALVPRLALSWEQVDPSTWRFKLRPGVVFHDGSPLNAENVKKSLDRNWSKPLTCGDKGKFFGDVNIETSAIENAGRQSRHRSGRHRTLCLRQLATGPADPAQAQ